MNIAISGISGFLGSHLAAFFSNENQVTGISTSNLPKDFPVYNFQQLDLMAIPDVVIHSHAAVVSGNAVLNNELLFKGNVAATEILVNAFPNAKHLYISSVSVYGNQEKTATENTPASPVSNYAISKFWGEKIVLQAEKSNVIRLSSLYGNGMKEGTLLPNYVSQALEKQQIEVWGDGSRTQNYIHVSDVVAAIAAMIEKDEWQQQVYLGVSDKEHSNIEMARLISDPAKATIVFKNTDLSPSVSYDNRLTKEKLGWEPKIQIPTAIQSYIEWKKRPY